MKGLYLLDGKQLIEVQGTSFQCIWEGLYLFNRYFSAS